MTIFKIATICILTAGTLVAFLSTGLGSEMALAVIAIIWRAGTLQPLRAPWPAPMRSHDLAFLG
jgi:predicted membrane channel-forming protein YqfA (hemolysin III family)